MLSAVLAFGSIAPGLAFAGEADSEQEGSAPPGALPGLEEGPELEPGGEESVLEELPGSLAPGEGEEEAPLEAEPPQEPDPSAQPESAVPSGPAAPPAVTESTPPPVEEAPSGPEYGPSYQPAPPPSAAPVENQPLVAPAATSTGSQQEAHSESAAPAAAEAPAPAAPSEDAPAPEPTPPATAPNQPSNAAGALTGRGTHTVHSGECLWSIAAALLPTGADNAEIAAEVQRLWRFNAARIGTGDPNLVYVGIELRLR